MHETKAELRRLFRARRNALVGQERAAAQNALVENLARVLAGENCIRIAIYLAVRGEANIDALLRGLARREIIFAAPANIHLPPTFKSVKSQEEIVVANSGARFPQEDAAVIAPQSFDAFLVPAIAFDLSGNRLGQGAGWYDRALSQAPNALKIGVAFECQIAPQLPRESHDVAMDLVVTESRIIAAQAKRDR